MSYERTLQININKLYENYLANWTPDTALEVGEFGTLPGVRFNKEGSLAHFLTSCPISRKRSKSATLELMYNASISTPLQSELGEQSNVSMNIGINFKDEGAFLYHMSDITDIQFESKYHVFELLGKMILSEKINWLDKYVLIDSIKEANNVKIMLSQDKNTNAEISFKGSFNGKAFLAESNADVQLIKKNKAIVEYFDMGNTAVLYKLIKPSFSPPDGGPSISISKAISKVRSWFHGEVAKPEDINLSDYAEIRGIQTGYFVSKDNENKIMMTLDNVNIEKIYNEKEKTIDEEDSIDHLIETETVKYYTK